MTSTTLIAQGRSPADDFGLGAIAEHNANGLERFPPYEEGKGLGIYHDGYAPAYQSNHSYLQNPPTPSPSEGVRTRSGRSARRTDSPFSTSKSRVSKSPMSKSKKSKKSKLDKSKTPQLTAPLSVLTKDMEVPLKDMGAWVNRPAEERRQEVEKRNGYVTRPMNSFMLYRSCYAERTKQWCTQNNHQVVSSVSGESWPMESAEVREQFNEWAKLERANHAGAHPDYKFSPTKASNKRRKDDSDVDDEPSDLDDNPDGEYRGGRSVRPRRQQPRELPFVPSSHGFDSTPYYQPQANGYDQAHYQFTSAGRPLPSNVAYDQHGLPYDPHTMTYLQTGVPQQQQQHQYQYAVQEPIAPRAPTPQTGYGLPGGGNQPQQDLFSSSRTATPMQQYNTFSRPMYPQYTTQPYQQAYHAPAPQPQMYSEHQQYLQAQMQPAQAIDPSLEAMLNLEQTGVQGHGQESHFDSAIGDLVGGEYYEQALGSDQTLEGVWSPGEGLR
jgi:hypothetical protein